MFNSVRTCLPLPRRVLSARARLLARAGARPRLPPLRPESLVRRLSADSSGGQGAPPSTSRDGEPQLQHEENSPTKPFGLEVQRDLYHIGTITIKKPGDTDIGGLIDRIEPVPYLMPHFKSPTAMLLVTPSFAAALRAPSNGGAPEAIGKAISRLLTHSLNYSSPLRNVRVVAAVVDKLPAPANNQDTGKVCEGLAYAMWFSDNVTRKNWTKRSTLEQDDTVGRLTFDIWDRFRLTDTDGQPRRDFYDTIHRLHLPLANTIFQTGQTSIMWNILYRVNETEEYQDGVALEEPRSLYADKVNDVKYQRVTWPLCGRYLAHEKKFFPAPNRTLHLLQVPLVPLTAARRIHASMGNIIRQISGHNEQPAPASQELEKAVSSYFEVTNQVPHSMPVWAMVFNERAVKYFSSAVLGVLGKQQPEKFSKSYDYAGVLSEYIQEAWRIDPKFFQFAIWKGLLRGNAKIHRVLSGGGGWGKKAGLISLDPRRYFEQSPRSTSSSLDADGHESHADALGRVAIPGSYIQFFASPASSLESPQYARDTSVFGTIPSSIDDIPQAGEGPAEIEVWPGWFGALSEQGMSMKYVVHEQQTHATEHYSQTMIDVPFSLFVTNSHLPGAKPQGSAAEDAKKVELKPSTYSPTNAKTASGLGRSDRQGRRSLHSNAQVSFIQLPRRSFSAGSVHRLKSDYLERLTRQWKRPMIPLSRRLREVEVAEGFSIRNIREDLLMTLPKYKRMRDFLHRLAAICQAESDRRPVPPKPRSHKSPTQLARELWARRARDCRTKVDELRQGSIKLLEAQLDVSNWQLNFWASCVRNLEEGRPLYWCKVNGELMPLRNRRLKILQRAIAAEQRRVAPLPFRASEVVDILDELVNNSRVKCKRAEDMVYKAVVKRRKKLIKARRARAAADSKIQEDKANSGKTGQVGGKSYKSTKLFVFNREVVVDNQWMVVPLPVASYRLRGHQRFLTKALERQVKVIRASGREKLEALQDNKTRVRVPEEVALDKSTMGIAELERVAGTVSGPGVTRDRPESSATWIKELKEPFETAREVVPGSPESSATWVKELKEPFETAREVVPGSPESGRPTLTYRSRPIPASVLPGRNQRRSHSTLVIAASNNRSPDELEDALSDFSGMYDSATYPQEGPQAKLSHAFPYKLSPANDEDDAAASSETSPYHFTLAPPTRREFARKRDLRLFQLRLIHRSLRRLARAELAYLDASIRLSELVCVRLTQRCVATDPRIWPLEEGLPDTPAGWDADARRNAWLRPRYDEEAGERVDEDSWWGRLGEGVTYSRVRHAVGKKVVEAARVVEREDNRGALNGAGPLAEEVAWVEAEIRRQRWKVARLRKKAELGKEEWYARRVGEYVESGAAAAMVAEAGEKSAVGKGMAAFRGYRDRLLRVLGERLKGEWRGWRKKALMKKMAELRAAEMWYLHKSIAASDRESTALQSEVAVLEQEIQLRKRLKLKNKKGGIPLGKRVRLVALKRGIDDVMEQRAADAWALAKDLDELLQRR